MCVGPLLKTLGCSETQSEVSYQETPETLHKTNANNIDVANLSDKQRKREAIEKPGAQLQPLQVRSLIAPHSAVASAGAAGASPGVSAGAPEDSGAASAAASVPAPAAAASVGDSAGASAGASSAGASAAASVAGAPGASTDGASAAGESAAGASAAGASAAGVSADGSAAAGAGASADASAPASAGFEGSDGSTGGFVGSSLLEGSCCPSSGLSVFAPSASVAGAAAGSPASYQCEFEKNMKELQFPIGFLARYANRLSFVNRRGIWHVSLMSEKCVNEVILYRKR